MTVPLIIDTDPGVDDAVALLVALASPELDLRAVTAVYGNVALPKATANAQRVLALAGRSDIPVAAGAGQPLIRPRPVRTPNPHGADGLGALAAALPAPRHPPDPRGAIRLAADVLAGAETPVTLVSIAPMTNLALLLAARPELRERIARIVALGGRQFNVDADPEAAHRVLVQREVPVTLVPLEVAARGVCDAGWLAELAAVGPRCATVSRLVERSRRSQGDDGVALPDAVVVLEAEVPGVAAVPPGRVADELLARLRRLDS